MDDVINGHKKAFKIRQNEKTPSANIKKMSDGNHVVTDFGGDQMPRNAIQICQAEEGISYREALVLLAGRYNIAGLSPQINKPDFEKRPATPEEKEGEYFFDIKPEITKSELETLGKKVTHEVCTKYNVYSLVSFTYIKNREAFVTKSTENYPIFVFIYENFKKIYQPKNTDKAFRFRYVGEKQKNFIFGLLQLEQSYEKFREQQAKDSFDDEEKTFDKLPEVIIASGERDALNVAGFGYPVVWLNSETATLTDSQFRDLRKYAENIYLLPDIDNTGKRMAIKQALKHLDLQIIWLPEKLSTYKDMRGNPRKDFCDYVEIYPHPEDFKKLIRVAMPLRFWDEYVNEKGVKYYFNNEQAYAFLAANGFFRLEDKNTKDGFVFIQITGNIVKEVKPTEIKNFVITDTKKRYLPIALRNMLHKSNQLSESALAGLPLIELDFTDFDKERQFLFFKNRTWEITKSDIIEHRPEQITRYVWQQEVIDHRVRTLDPPFLMSYDNLNKLYDIEVKNTDSLFFRYLINTSRIHWQRELEIELEKLPTDEQEKYLKKNKFRIDSNLLTMAEREEQKQHLVNKIFALGYLLHRYKNPSRPWAVFAMDNKISETGESHGRSGKSLAFKGARHFMKSVTLNGRNPKLTENQHIYDRVTEHTDFVLVDDCNQYLNFDFFFSELTGEMVVNPKNNKSYEIPFAKVPKFAFTSNFTLRNLDPSTEGRLLYTVFSDYYHIQATSGEYRETRAVSDDFGKNLFDDYTEDEWNADFNFFARCIQFYLSVPVHKKLNPPMGNVTLRNLRTEMTEVFKDWADSYLLDEKLDNFIIKSDIMDEFARLTNQKRWTPNRFSKSLRAWCRFNGYYLNPAPLTNSKGRILKKLDGKTQECYFVQTTENIKPEFLSEENTYEDDDSQAPF